MTVALKSMPPLPNVVCSYDGVVPRPRYWRNPKGALTFATGKNSAWEVCLGCRSSGGDRKLNQKLRRVAGCSTYLISNEGKQLNSSTGAVIERPVPDAITQGLSVAVSVPALAGSAAAITIDTSFDGSP